MMSFFSSAVSIARARLYPPALMKARGAHMSRKKSLDYVTCVNVCCIVTVMKLYLSRGRLAIHIAFHSRLHEVNIGQLRPSLRYFTYKVAVCWDGIVHSHVCGVNVGHELLYLTSWRTLEASPRT